MEGTAQDLSAQYPEFEKTLQSNFYLSQGDMPGTADAEFLLNVKNVPDQAQFPNLYSYYLNMAAFHPDIVSTWKAAAPAQTKQAEAKKDDDDIDLFGDDDEEDKEAAKEAAAKRKADAEASKKKKVVVAKSIFFFDVKVYEQEQDLEELANRIRTQVQMDGLVWNNEHKIIPVAYGMNKLQMICVVEDDKVLSDDVFEKILVWEDEVQSVDVASMQKV